MMSQECFFSTTDFFQKIRQIDHTYDDFLKTVKKNRKKRIFFFKISSNWFSIIFELPVGQRQTFLNVFSIFKMGFGEPCKGKCFHNFFNYILIYYILIHSGLYLCLYLLNKQILSKEFFSETNSWVLFFISFFQSYLCNII